MALQVPAFANGEPSPKFISTLQEGTLTTRDAVMVTLTFRPINAGFGKALRVMAWVTSAVRKTKDMTESSATSSIWRFIIIPP
jgi:hypothetical protein